MKAKLKRPTIILLFGVILLILGLSWWNSQWIMKINGQKMTEAEYSFYQKSNPRLSEKALQQKIVEEKVQLQQAEKQKINVILDYKSLKRELDKINQENEQKIKENQVVYGLRKYDERTFYRYSLSLAINELEKKEAQEITTRMARSYYKKHQSEFKEINAKELYRVSGKQTTIEQLRKEAVTQEQLTERSDVDAESVSLNETTLRDWIKYREVELSVVNDLKTGNWSGMFENADKSWSYYCLSDQAGELQSFETVKEKIVLKLEKDHYQAKVKKWVKQAEVEVK
ncbi:MAG: hypothetical protein ACTIOK_13085 [Enterococcus malodoratus]